MNEVKRLIFKVEGLKKAYGSFEALNIKKLEIQLDKKKFMNLLFDPGHDLEERIINEQFDN